MNWLHCYSMVAWLIRLEPRPFILHSWLSQAELVLFAAVLLVLLLSSYVVISSAAKMQNVNMRQALRSALTNSTLLLSNGVRRLNLNMQSWWKKLTATKIALDAKSTIRDSSSSASTDGSSSPRQNIPPGKGRVRVAGVFITVLVVSWTLSGWLAVRDHHRIKALELQLAKYQAETVTETNVTILGILPDGDIAYKSDQEPEGGAWRPCLVDESGNFDTRAYLKTAIGWTADWAKWEERGSCKSIVRSDLKFSFRDLATNFKYLKGE
jgi:hypothetical protein